MQKNAASSAHLCLSDFVLLKEEFVLVDEELAQPTQGRQMMRPLMAGAWGQHGALADGEGVSAYRKSSSKEQGYDGKRNSSKK